ncbi:MAG: HEAT repeat domain-containing protein [Elusimicrobia bacterium]|nr:HEAT repeat domain-containing protein [Elusimicrobiota bacterium]
MVKTINKIFILRTLARTRSQKNFQQKENKDFINSFNHRHYIFLSLFIILLFKITPSSNLRAEDEFISKVRQGKEKIVKELPFLRIKEEDFYSPPRWILPHTISKVEELLAYPLEAPLQISQWNISLLNNKSFASFVEFAQDSLSLENELDSNFNFTKFKPPKKLDPQIQNPVSEIVKAIEKAIPILKQSYEELSEEEKKDILRYFNFPIESLKLSNKENDSKFSSKALNVKLPKSKIKIFKSLEKFKQDKLFKAGEILLKQIDQEIKGLEKWSKELNDPKRTPFKTLEWQSPIGKVLISGKEDNIYDSGQLKDVVLLIDGGGKNSYYSNPGAAGPGEIKIVIDFGDDVTIISSQTAASAGAGIFGIGFLFLPNPSGMKIIRTNSFSQGLGLCGIGGIFVNGKGFFKGQRYVQGVGSFGLGIFQNTRGEESFYETELYGQGAGLTKGLGLFIHHGSSSTFRAGLVDPDPRETLGATSLCQGVGYGPRGYAGGGIGVCALKGNSLTLESSYFAQGAGYWHGLGSFYLDGNANMIQSRRYAKGSGIHSALGSFFIKGDDNAIVNWGVGPAYGWDSGTGWAFLFGDRNRLQTEWGAGTANINSSKSFSFFSGNQNKFDLPALGSAQISHDLPDYAVSMIEGKDNLFKLNPIKKEKKVSETVFTSPWGEISFNEVLFKKELDFPKLEWKKLPQLQPSENAQTDLGKEVKESLLLPPDEKIENLLQIAASFSVDQVNPQKAFEGLSYLKEDELPYILDSFVPEDMDGFFQVRALVALWGKNISKFVIKNIKNETNPQRKAFLITLLSLSNMEESWPTLKKALDDSDWRIQVQALRVLGSLLNKDKALPGRLYLLKRLEKFLSTKTPPKKISKVFIDELNSLQLVESLSLFSLIKTWSNDQRSLIAKALPNDKTSSMDEKTLKNILEQIKETRGESLESVKREIEFSTNQEEAIREKIKELLIPRTNMDLRNSSRFSQPMMILGLKKDVEPRKEIIHSALIALGKIGHEEDLKIIVPYLEHPSALVKEGALISMGRIGKDSLKTLEEMNRSSDPQKRIQSILALPKTTDKSLLTILKKGLKDKDEKIQKFSLTIIEQLPASLSKDRENLKKIGKKLKTKEGSPLEAQQLFLYGN